MRLPKLELKRKKSFRKGGFHTNPNIGWEILVLAIGFAVILAVTYGTVTFLRTSRDLEAPTLLTDAQKKVIARERVLRALEYYGRKAEQSQAIISSPSRIVDPSR